jgi:CRP-like cAMP-binding protein
VVHDGVVGIWYADREIAVLGRGACFGEQAILTGRPRSARAIARTAVCLLALPEQAFRAASEPLDLAAAIERANWLGELVPFQQLSYLVRLDLAADFQPEHYQAGQTIVRYGDVGDDCFMLVSGHLRVLDAQEQTVDQMRCPVISSAAGRRFPISALAGAMPP